MTKLSMIIELFNNDDLLDTSEFLDVSYDEVEGANELEEAPDVGAAKGADFPVDLGGVTYLQSHTSDTHIGFNPVGVCRMPKVSFVQHHTTMPFHARNDVDGNSLVDEEDVYWDSQPTLYALSFDH